MSLSPDPDRLYGAAYYAEHCGTPYERTEEWLHHLISC